MFVRTQPGGDTIHSQPSSAVLAPGSKRQGRNSVILTNLSATTFYVKLGLDADAGTAGVGGDWTFVLAPAPAPAVVIEGWTKDITCDPAPSAGDINVAEIMGSTYH